MTEKLTHRTIAESDLKKVCQLPLNKEELFFMFPKAEYPLSVEQLQTVIENRSDSTVILLDSEIVGFANFYEVKEKEYCTIGNVIVSSEFRNRGIGQFLIQTMENIGIEKYNVSEFRLSCFNTNTNGILLYSKLGYKPYDIEKHTNNDKAFALIKTKRIYR